MKLSERIGPVLTGRVRAQDLQDALRTELESFGQVTLDFEGVEAISPSFADEIFVRFVAGVGADQVRFENLSQHLEQVLATVRRRAA